MEFPCAGGRPKPRYPPGSCRFCSPPGNMNQPWFAAPKLCQSARTLTFNQGAQTRVDQCGALLHARDALRLGEQMLIQVQGRRHGSTLQVCIPSKDSRNSTVIDIASSHPLVTFFQAHAPCGQPSRWVVQKAKCLLPSRSVSSNPLPGLVNPSWCFPLWNRHPGSPQRRSDTTPKHTSFPKQGDCRLWLRMDHGMLIA